MEVSQVEFDILSEIGRAAMLGPDALAASSLAKDYEGADVAEALASLFEQGFIARAPGGYRLSPQGHDFYLAHRAEYSVDPEGDEAATEQVSQEPHGPPRKPFDATLIRMERAGFSVFETVRRIGTDRIRLNPDFQRAFVWDLKRQSQLIESLLMRIPLPAIYVDASKEDNWEVIDGLQRLSTLRDFLNPKAGFALTELAFLKELNGKKFSELPSAYRTIVEDAQLTFFCLQPGVEPSAKYIIFSRLNTGGLALVPQEIRHALYQGPITRVLRELALHTDFLEATQRGFRASRMEDREVILRALAFARLKFEGGIFDYFEYDDLDDFLNRSMDWFNQPENLQALNELAIKLLRAMRSAKAVLGKYAFRKFYAPGGRRGALNKALFEAWAVALMGYETAQVLPHKDSIVQKFAELLSGDEDFERSVTSSTGKLAAVLERFNTVAQLLDEVSS